MGYAKDMGSIFREPGNIIHKIEDVLIESLLLEAHRGMPARDSLNTPQHLSSNRDTFFETPSVIKRQFIFFVELVGYN